MGVRGKNPTPTPFSQGVYKGQEKTNLLNLNSHFDSPV